MSWIKIELQNTHAHTHTHTRRVDLSFYSFSFPFFSFIAVLNKLKRMEFYLSFTKDLFLELIRNSSVKLQERNGACAVCLLSLSQSLSLSTITILPLALYDSVLFSIIQYFCHSCLQEINLHFSYIFKRRCWMKGCKCAPKTKIV